MTARGRAVVNNEKEQRTRNMKMWCIAIEVEEVILPRGKILLHLARIGKRAGNGNRDDKKKKVFENVFLNTAVVQANDAFDTTFVLLVN